MIIILERAEDMRCNVKITCLDMLVPAGHLLRKIEKAIDFPRFTAWWQEDGCNLSTAYKRPMSKQGFFRDGYREFKSNPKICAVVPFCTNAPKVAITRR